jgi:hypothetical protein
MPRTEKYFVGPGLLSDIRQTITRVAGMPDKTKGAAFRVGNTEALPRPGARVRFCEFTGAWSKGSSRDIAFLNTTQTISVSNLLFPIPVLSDNTNTPTRCVVAKDLDTWRLINIEFSSNTVLSNVLLQPNSLQFGTREVLAPGRTAATTGVTITECEDESATAEQLNFFFR